MEPKQETTCTNDPNFAIICAFFQTFGDKISIKLPNTEQLQLWFENIGETDEGLKELHIKLMQALRMGTSSTRWEVLLSKFCYTYSAADAWEIGSRGYKNCSLQMKVRVLRELVESLFTLKTFRTQISKNMDSLRPQPIGRDRFGNGYWVTEDTELNLRVYQENLENETWQVVATSGVEMTKLIKILKDNELSLSPEISGTDGDGSNSGLKESPQKVMNESGSSDKENYMVSPNLKIEFENGIPISEDEEKPYMKLEDELELAVETNTNIGDDKQNEDIFLSCREKEKIENTPQIQAYGNGVKICEAQGERFCEIKDLELGVATSSNIRDDRQNEDIFLSCGEKEKIENTPHLQVEYGNGVKICEYQGDRLGEIKELELVVGTSSNIGDDKQNEDIFLSYGEKVKTENTHLQSEYGNGVKICEDLGDRFCEMKALELLKCTETIKDMVLKNLISGKGLRTENSNMIDKINTKEVSKNDKKAVHQQEANVNKIAKIDTKIVSKNYQQKDIRSFFPTEMKTLVVKVKKIAEIVNNETFNLKEEKAKKPISILDKKTKNKNYNSDSESDNEKEIEDDYESDYDNLSFHSRSDHEFSPESDFDYESQQIPIKLSRTVNENTINIEPCMKCGKKENPQMILLCEKCNNGYHCDCLSPVLHHIPEGEWKCPTCQHDELVHALKLLLKRYQRKRKNIENESSRTSTYGSEEPNYNLRKRKKIMNCRDNNEDTEAEDEDNQVGRIAKRNANKIIRNYAKCIIRRR